MTRETKALQAECEFSQGINFYMKIVFGVIVLPYCTSASQTNLTYSNVASETVERKRVRENTNSALLKKI